MNLRMWSMAVAVVVWGCGVDDEPPVGTGAGTGASSVTASDSAGTESTGTDDSADSTGSEVPDVDCQTELESDLPGVSIEIDTECATTLAAAQAGITTSYTVGISDPLDGVDSGTMCYETPEGGIHVEWSVSGAGHNHCHCDVGLCPDYVPSPTTLVPGDTAGSFEWFAFDWFGPSDFDPPFGDPFVAGTYTIEVVATGFYDDGVESMTPFTVRARRPIVLVD